MERAIQLLLLLWWIVESPWGIKGLLRHDPELRPCLLDFLRQLYHPHPVGHHWLRSILITRYQLLVYSESLTSKRFQCISNIYVGDRGGSISTAREYCQHRCLQVLEPKAERVARPVL